MGKIRFKLEEPSVFDPRVSKMLDELALAYKDVCLSYIVEVGKLNARYNGETLQWLARSDSGRHLRKLVKELKQSYLGRSREEKYYLLREVYALKPGVHERFYPVAHEGRTLRWLQEQFVSQNSLDAKATIFLKHSLALENFYDAEPFLDVEERWVFPSTIKGAQSALKFLLASQNWRSLDELTPLNGWIAYAPCSINEGPFVMREGKVLFKSLGDLESIAVGYTEVTCRCYAGL